MLDEYFQRLHQSTSAKDKTTNFSIENMPILHMFYIGCKNITCWHTFFSCKALIDKFLPYKKLSRNLSIIFKHRYYSYEIRFKFVTLRVIEPDIKKTDVKFTHDLVLK